MSPDNTLSPRLEFPLWREMPAVNPLLDESAYQEPVDGRQTTTTETPSPSKSARRAGWKADRTVRIAAPVGAEFTELENIARYRLPLSDARARKLYVVAVAPGIFVHVVPSVLTCHCGVGNGDPVAPALNVVSTSGLIVCEKGASVIVTPRENEICTRP
jgi:hypothetical protein